MATPSSSGTSPSPALSFTVPATASEKSTDEPNDQDIAEREERRRKILARTEFAKVKRAWRQGRVVPAQSPRPFCATYWDHFSARVSMLLKTRNTGVRDALSACLASPSLLLVVAKHDVRDVHATRIVAISGGHARSHRITRALRSTLSLASYKAKHNVVDVPLRNLEMQVAQRARAPNQQAGASSPSHITTFGGDKKRKAGNALNNTVYYNSPLAQSHNMGAPGQAPQTAAKSLFASILALPPAKRARTIHNPEAPPVPPPPPPSQGRHGNQRSPKKSSKKGKEAVAQSKGRAVDKGTKGSTKTRSSFSGETENVNDTDMKAAATLTDLLFSRSGGTASPRSSFSAPTSASRMAPAGPSVGAIPLSQTSSMSSVSAAPPRVNAHVRTGSNASISSTVTGSFEQEGHVQLTDEAMDARRSATPNVTPHLATRTAVAPTRGADLMLLLANSPSPARPSAPRDQDITRNVYAAGRVLFPSGDPSASGHGSGRGSDSGTAGGRDLVRGMDGGIFSSMISNDIGEGSREVEGRGAGSTPTSPPLSQGSKASPPDGKAHSTSVRPRVPSLSLGQLLPSPPLPSRVNPQTPATAFNMNDYINITPSPAAAPAPLQSQASTADSTSAVAPTSSSQPLSSSVFPSSQNSSIPASGTPGRFRSAVSVSSPLRKSFDRESMGIGVGGRKLFENEPGGAGGSGNGARKMRFGEGVDSPGSLGSGIDLVHT
ncbi:hypothetical protein DFH11DRAFT_1728512 [Phellopilus nigrolimitatus]|nr:hypothetical protein DFH11DRAFT_1728512 [Phellopilus nigrolimitatus]